MGLNIDQPFITQCKICKGALADSSMMVFARKDHIVFLSTAEAILEKVPGRSVSRVRCKKCNASVGQYNSGIGDLLYKNLYNIMTDKCTFQMSSSTPSQKSKIIGKHAVLKRKKQKITNKLSLLNKL